MPTVDTTNKKEAMHDSTISARTSSGGISAYFKEVIYGGTDGIITTFAVVAGFSGAALSNETTTQLSFLVVLLFGLANLFADGVSMGLSNFLSVRSEQDLYRAKQLSKSREIDIDNDALFATTISILEEKGYAHEDATQLARLYQKNKDYWLDFMMNHALQQTDPRGEKAVYTGIITFLSFLLFGAIPLFPFMVQASAPAEIVFYYSVGSTLVALVALGILKWNVVGTSLLFSVCEIVLVGSVAAGIAFFVGTLFTL